MQKPVNQEQFSQLISNPANISAAHLPGLEALSLQFPYCQLLSFMQAKPHYDQVTAEAEEKVQKAAVVAISRYKLKKFLEIPAQIVSETVAGSTESRLENLPDITTPVDTPSLANDSQNTSAVLPPLPDKSAAEPINSSTGTSATEEKDLDIESFNNRIKRQKQLEIIDKFIKTEPRISSLNTVKDISAKDLSETSSKVPDGLLSENLANIMLRQGKTDKAIEIYEKLILKFPEKKTYFAEKIDNLKNK